MNSTTSHADRSGASLWMSAIGSPGAHTDYSMMVKDLQTLGCSIVSLRGAALLALAAIMPAGPLSDLTGISVGVANRWQTLAAAAYSGYPALRLE